MTTSSADDDFAARATREAALVGLEQKILGWQLYGAPGACEAAAELVRSDAPFFQVPHNRVQEAIFASYDAGRAVTALAIAAEFGDCDGFNEIEGGAAGYLQNLALAAPATISPADARKQIVAAIRAHRHTRGPKARVGEVALLRADTVEPEEIEWLWPGWIAIGKFHLLAGRAETGKTTLALEFAAKITKGLPFPDGTAAPQGSVMIWSGEDSPADTLLPRFIACGGDRSRLHFVSGIRAEDGKTRPFDPAQDVEALVAAARQVPDLKLLIIDPVVSALTGDSNKNAETRRALQPLVDFAVNCRAAVIGITHYSKNTAGRDTLDRVTGSLAFGAVPRLVMATGMATEQGIPSRLVRAKSNIGPSGGGFEYTLEQVPIGPRKNIPGQRIVWGEPLEGHARGLLEEIETAVSADGGKLESAKAWLVEFLGRGTAPVTLIKDAAKAKGHAWATVLRAKTDLKIESRKNGLTGGWDWKKSDPEEVQ